MLTKLTTRNFKRFDSVEIELGNPVVFIGPNNSGKTTALQALALWDIGLKRWQEKRGARVTPWKRPGVTINRRDLIAVPVPEANLLWRDLHVRDVRRIGGRQQTQNVRVEIIVDGASAETAWTCGFEFDYANDESLYCRPLRLANDRNAERMAVPKGALDINVAFLPPMSGLADREFAKQTGEISFLIGQGRTAEVLRNLCLEIYLDDSGNYVEGGHERWRRVRERIAGLFGVQLDDPQYIAERGEIVMTYREGSGVRLDLSSSGRGLQQTLLLLAHLALHPGSVLLLDEPDAHLEILRQRQIYQILSEAALENGSQIVAASHSEVVLNEAADRDVVVAFVGKPHRIDDRGSQLLKALKEIGFEQYYQAEQTGWVLYLEGSTDLAILRAFAEKLEHPAQAVLERPFVRYVQDQPPRARDHFRGLREAKPDLVGYALYDQLGSPLQPTPELQERMWSRREIENYLCHKDALLTWADSFPWRADQDANVSSKWRVAMEECLSEVAAALQTLGRGSPWSPTIKASDEFLDPLFAAFFGKLGLPNLMRKTDYHILAGFVPADQVDAEVGMVLDDIVAVCERARPAGEGP